MTQTKEFTDQEFSAACRELDEPNVKSFELFVDSNDVKIYRQYDQVLFGFWAIIWINMPYYAGGRLD